MTKFSTDFVAPKERLDFWQELVCNHLLDASATIDVVDKKRVFGAISTHNLGRSKLMSVVSPKNFVERDQKRVQRAKSEFTLLLLQVSGTSVFAQNERVAHMKPGDITLYDSAFPHTLDVNVGYESVILRVPRNDLIRRIPLLENATAVSLDTRTGMGRVAKRFMTSLIQEIDSIERHASAAMNDALLDTISTAVNSAIPGSLCKISTNQRALLTRIKLYTDTNLNEDSLSPKHVAAAHGISTRYVNRLFESEGTSITRWIRQRRLIRCAHDLQSLSDAHRSIGEIAYSWGFKSLAYFSREFRAEFGYSASDCRNN